MSVSGDFSGTANVSRLADNINALNGPPMPEPDFARITALLGDIQDPIPE